MRKPLHCFSTNSYSFPTELITSSAEAKLSMSPGFTFSVGRQQRPFEDGCILMVEPSWVWRTASDDIPSVKGSWAFRRVWVISVSCSLTERIQVFNSWVVGSGRRGASEDR